MEPRTTIRYESASAVIKLHEESSSSAELTRVFASKRRQGHGTGLMERVTKFADANGLQLYLKVHPYKMTNQTLIPNVEQLVSFYQKHGFELYNSNQEPVMVRRARARENN